MHPPTTHRIASSILLASSLALILASCGGGGGGGGGQPGGSGATASAATAPVTPTPEPIAVIPPLSTNPIQLVFGGTVGAPGTWPDGDTAAGGDGIRPVDGINCSGSEAYHIHTHLSIVRDGQLLAIPANVGIPAGCTYEIHTHDKTGEIHLEAPAKKRFTLGNFFAVWGQPLSRTNIAGITGAPVTVYVTDGSNTVAYTGDIADLELTSHRLITIQIGKPVATIPAFLWDTPS
ncbi:MAG: hypothetical protein H7327_16325 [Herminiimonas sp.]|nr:hypothetical protein [Herminiimonas sp.]